MIYFHALSLRFAHLEVLHMKHIAILKNLGRHLIEDGFTLRRIVKNGEWSYSLPSISLTEFSAHNARQKDGGVYCFPTSH
jgi:hypothetical protein